MWTEKGVAVLGTYIQQYEMYKNALKGVNEELAKYQRAYKGNEAYYKNLGIDSEQELYDKQRELIDQQEDYAKAVSDTEQSVKDMYESQIDAIEDWSSKTVDAYKDYIDVVSEALDAERELYKFKKDTEKQIKDIAELERKIASLSGSDDRADMAERRKLEKDLYDSKGDLSDSFYDHAMSARQDALDKEAQAYEESMNNYIEKLRTTLDEATLNMDQFMSYVTNAVMVNAATIEQEYHNTGLEISEDLTTPWHNAAAEMSNYEGNATELLNAWTSEEGFFTKFKTDATDRLTSPWDAGTNAANTFKDNVESAMNSVVEAVKTNVTTATNSLNSLSGKVSSVYQDIVDTEKRASNLNNGGYDTSSKIPATSEDKFNANDVKMLQQILLKVFGQNVNITGLYDMKTKNAVKNMQSTLKKSSHYTGSVDGLYGAGTYDALVKYVNDNIRKSRDNKKPSWFKGEVVSFFQNRSSYVPKNMYAKGTLGTKTNELAIVDELGPELIMHADPTTGRLQYLTKGSSVIPSDLTKELMKLAHLGVDGLTMPKFDSGINLMSNYISKPELNIAFDSLVHVDNCDEGTLKDLEKMVDNKINQFSRQMNYAIKRFK